MDLILQVAVYLFPINFISSWDNSELWSQIMQNVLGTFLEEERYCNESNLFTLSNSEESGLNMELEGDWKEEGRLLDLGLQTLVLLVEAWELSLQRKDKICQ